MNIIETNFKWNNGLSRRSSTKRIVLHHAAAVTATVTQIDQWHKGNGWSGIGYHFYVRKNGEVYRGRPIWAVGSHAQGRNSDSIGICAEGNFDIEKMPQAQKSAIKELLKYLKELYPNTTISGHKDVGATGCPGNNYPLSELKQYYKTMESEDLTMAQYEELKTAIEAVSKENALLKEQVNELRVKAGYYNYIDNNMPDSYKPTIQKLVNSGFLQGNEKGELMLTTDMMRILTILDRNGTFN